MEPLAFIVVLFAAISHASWNTLAKHSGDPWIRMAIGQAISGVICLLFLFFFPFPAPPSWPFLLGSVCAHQLYYVGVSLGYKFGDLSQVYPIQRGISPLLITFGAFVLTGERLNHQGLWGILIISLSILMLSFTNRNPKEPLKPLLVAIFTGTMISFYTIFDALGGRSSGNVFGYIVWLNFLDAIPFSLSVFILKSSEIKKSFKYEVGAGLGIGILGTAAYAAVIWALSFSPMAYVSSLRETSVVLAAWIGAYLLKEPFGKLRIIAALLVVFGIFILQSS